MSQGVKLILEEIKTLIKLREAYGEAFCEIVGTQTLINLPEFTWGAVSVIEKNGVYKHNLTPSVLGEHSAVRGMTTNQIPFIAIKIEVTNPQETVANKIGVEVIFNSRKHNHHHFIPVSSIDDSGTPHVSYLYPPDIITELGIVHKLLIGETITITDLGEMITTSPAEGLQSYTIKKV